MIQKYKLVTCNINKNKKYLKLHKIAISKKVNFKNESKLYKTYAFDIYKIYNLVLSIYNGSHGIKVLNKKSFILHVIYW